MIRFPIYLIASAVALSSAGLLADTPSRVFDDRPGGVIVSPPDSTAGQPQQLGSALADEATTRDIQAALAKVVNDGLTENRFDNLGNHLAKADRDRIGNLKNQKLDDLNRAIGQFRSDFKSKYRQDFDLRSELLKTALVYSGPDKKTATVTLMESSFTGKELKGGMPDTSGRVKSTTIDRHTIVTGTLEPRTGNPVSDTSSAALGNRTSIDSQGDNSNTVIRGSEAPRVTDTTIVRTTDTTRVTDANTPGVNTGISGAGNTDLTPGVGGSVMLSMIREGAAGGSWKINIPDQITADQLQSNLIKHIQMLCDQKATWPSDVNSAYQSAAFHVFKALNDSSFATER